MPARLSALVIWALVAVSVVYYALRLFARAPQTPAYTVSVGDSTSAAADYTRLLGAPSVAAAQEVVAPEMAARFRLTGVMAPKVPGNQGVALIAVDGKMPRAYRVGSRIDGELVLQSVSLRSASIGPTQGSPAVVLELPPLPPPTTGTLAPAAPESPAAVPPPPAPQAPAINPPPRRFIPRPGGAGDQQQPSATR